MTVYIYALRDPQTSYVRYVGKANNPSKRLSAHISRSKISNIHSANWIRNLVENKMRPIMDILEICEDEKWEDREKFWIAYYRDIYDLTNILDGGEHCATYGRLGSPWSEQQRVNYRKARLGFKVLHTKDGNKKRADGVRRYYENNKRKIIQFSLSGEKIKEWNSSVEAGVALKINYSNINNVCSKKSNKHSAGGYMWRFSDQCNFEIIQEFSKHINGRKQIYQFDKRGNKVGEFISIKDASITSGISRTAISNCISNRAKSSGGFIWREVTY